MRTKCLLFVAMLLSPGAVAQGSDEVISLDGSFGSFISLGASREAVTALGPDRVEEAVTEDERN